MITAIGFVPVFYLIKSDRNTLRSLFAGAVHSPASDIYGLLIACRALVLQTVWKERRCKSEHPVITWPDAGNILLWAGVCAPIGNYCRKEQSGRSRLPRSRIRWPAF